MDLADLAPKIGGVTAICGILVTINPELFGPILAIPAFIGGIALGIMVWK